MTVSFLKFSRHIELFDFNMLEEYKILTFGTLGIYHKIMVNCCYTYNHKEVVAVCNLRIEVNSCFYSPNFIFGRKTRLLKLDDFREWPLF